MAVVALPGVTPPEVEIDAFSVEKLEMLLAAALEGRLQAFVIGYVMDGQKETSYHSPPRWEGDVLQATRRAMREIEELEYEED